MVKCDRIGCTFRTEKTCISRQRKLDRYKKMDGLNVGKRNQEFRKIAYYCDGCEVGLKLYREGIKNG